MDFVLESDLFKARTHKYVKRTGSPGNYKYWYKLPDGRIVAEDDKQEMGRLDHIKRLLAARMAGKHTKTDAEIAAETGGSNSKVNSAKRNMKRGGRDIGGRIFRTGHDYSDEHYDEAMGPAASDDTESPAPAAEPPGEAATETSQTEEQDSSPADITPAAGARTTRGGSTYGTGVVTRIAGRDNQKLVANGWNVGMASAEKTKTTGDLECLYRIRLLDNGQWEFSAQEIAMGGEQHNEDFRSLKAALDKANEMMADQERSWEEQNGESESEAEVEAQAQDETPEEAPEALAEEPAAESAQEDGLTEEQKKLIEKLRASGIDLTPPPAVRAQEAVKTARRIRESSPTSQNASEIHEVSPELAEADEPISEMMAAQARGENPYLQRAKDIYHNIQGDLKPERKDLIRHLMSAINVSKDHVTGKVDKARLLASYKEISGKNVRGLTTVAEEFEKGTFMSLDEILENKPVDPEIERMKRGFAAKQFARMKPFLKASWTQANPGAPPPYPTYGDMKSWTEHGSKPSWAGTTRMAVPKEVHDAAYKGADGKPKHPPAWMPIHMAPVWKYVMTKLGDDSAYQAQGRGISADSNSPTGHRVSMGSQAGYQEGMVVNAIRKYVQMRGGADQLTDIPASKLAEVGLSHSDIFKAMDKDDLTDRAIKKLMLHKIIDPVALVPFLNEEIEHSSKKEAKKSFSLVIDASAPAWKSEQVLKSELIEKIKIMKQKRGA